MSFTAWAWAVRDAKDKPPAGQLAVIFMLGTRMDPATGCGWTRRVDLMADAGVKRDTVTAATIWAIEHHLVRRLDTGRRRGDGSVSYSLWVLTDPVHPAVGGVSRAEQGVVDPGTSRAEQGAVEKSQGRKWGTSRAAQGVLSSKTSEVRPVVKDPPPAGVADPVASRAEQGAVENLPAVRPASGDEAADGDVPLTARTLVAEWLEHCPERPPGRVIGQISKHLKNLLDGDKIAYEHVRAGLALWHQKGDQHPATLDSFVNAAMNGARPGGRLTRHDERVAQGLALAEELRQQEQERNQ